jgi:hypothetical protein
MRLLIVGAAVATLGFATEGRTQADLRYCLKTHMNEVRNICDFPIVIRVEPAKEDLDADTIEQVLMPGEYRQTWPRWTFTVLRRATPADLKAAASPSNPR